MYLSNPFATTKTCHKVKVLNDFKCFFVHYLDKVFKEFEPISQSITSVRFSNDFNRAGIILPMLKY